MDRRITLGSLFDGIGGFPLCAAISGITPVWAAEVDPACIAVTKFHFPDMLHLGDISKINGADTPPVDIITFGSPCQDLSAAGKQKGIRHTENGDTETTRSGLFIEAIRIIYEMRAATNGKYPTYIVWENVAGAFSSNHGRDFRTVLEEITKTHIPMPASGKWANAGLVRGGAVCAAWRLLDAQYWGVSQRRKRIYLVGSFGSNAAEEILFKRDSVRGYLTPCGTTREGITADTQTSVGRCNLVYDARGNGEGQIVPTITGDHNSRVTDYAAIVVQSAGFHGQNSVTAASVELQNESVPTLTALKQADVLCLQGNMIGREAKNGPNGSGINENTCFTLTAMDRHAVVYALDRASFNQGINAKYDFEVTDSGVNSTLVAKGPSAVAYEIIRKWIVRRLTPLECERLQGYPDYWTVLPELDSMTAEQYEFFKAAYLLDKTIKGQAVKKIPNREQLIKWYNKLDSDGTRYKQLGNSLAIPCALRIIGGIAEYITRGGDFNDRIRI